RLNQPVALITKLFSVDMPVVDGILFNENGIPQSNFAMKSVSRVDSPDMDRTIRGAILRAEASIRFHYSAKRWQEISDNNVTPKFGPDYRSSINAARRRVFGLDQSHRKVTIVIDYSKMPEAILYLRHQGLDGGIRTHSYISLDRNRASTVELN